MALQHAREAGQVSFEPVLLRVAISGEAQIVDHGVDVVFEFRDFTAGFHLNGAGQVTFGHRRRDFGNRAHLVGQVVGQQVYVAGEILPGTGGSGHVGLATQTSFHTDLACDGSNLIGESSKRAGHVVDGFGQGCDFPLGVHRQFLSQLAVGNGGHDFHDAAYLFGQVGSHYVYVVCEILPRAGDAGHLRLAAELAVGADLAGHAGYFSREGVELVHHRIDGILELENFSLHVYRDFARQIAASHGRSHFGDVTHLTGKISGHGVH